MPRAVTPPTEREPRASMSVLGWLVAAGSLLVLLPALPLLAVGRLYDAVAGDGTEAVRPDADRQYEEGEADPWAAA